MWGGPGGQGGWANLTQDQIANLGNLRQAFLTETADLRSGFIKKRLELQSLLVQATPDAQEVVAKQKEMGDIASRLREKGLLAQLEARKLLTPEQIAQLPPGCTPGFGNLNRGFGPGFGRGYGRGMASGKGWRQSGGWW
jgi:Spy/CpxP family protein refolding chaperone